MSSFDGPRISPAFEIVVATLMVLAAGAFIASLYASQVRRVDEGILKAQLRAFRMQEKLFTIVNGRGPVDMKELVNDDYSLFPMGGRPLKQQPSAGMLKSEAVLAAAVDKEGYPVDPWGNRYQIQPGTGRIHSATEGYEAW